MIFISSRNVVGRRQAYPKFEAAQNVEAFPYAAYAEMSGFKGIRVERPEDIGHAWEQAFSADRSVLLEFESDPDVPPLPPHITWDQAKAYMTALEKGDPNEVGVIRQSLRELFAGILPGHGRDD